MLCIAFISAPSVRYMIPLFTEALSYVSLKIDEIPVNVIINKRLNDKISNQMKEIIIRSMDSGMSGEEVAKLVGRKGHTVRDIYRRYVKTGVKKNQKKGKPKLAKLNQEQKQKVRQWVDHNCTLTLKKLGNKCIEEWPELGSIC